jgi:hypothetical protein
VQRFKPMQTSSTERLFSKSIVNKGYWRGTERITTERHLEKEFF